MYQHFPLHGDILAARHFLYYSLILPPTKLKKRVENWGRKEVKTIFPSKISKLRKPQDCIIVTNNAFTRAKQYV